MRPLSLLFISGTLGAAMPAQAGPKPANISWAKAGVWLKVFEALAASSPQSLHLIDSSIVRAHQHAAGGKKGVRITPLAVLVAD